MRNTLAVGERHYIGDLVFDGDVLLYANFGGGYFDGDGNPHYMFTDWQGNVTMVTDGQGTMEQHTGYYPYGEPWSEPSGQPYLYGGKERMRDNGLYEYDFQARRLNPSACLWTTPDPLADRFASSNPYVYCAGNPVRYIDPSGCVVEDPSEIKDHYVKLLKKKIRNLQGFNFDGVEDLLRFYNDQLKQIKKLEKSKITYTVLHTKKEDGYITVDTKSGNILIYVPGKEDADKEAPHIAHELQHAYQFETGKLSICPPDANKLPTLYDLEDEMEAYKAKDIMQSGLLYFTRPDEIGSTTTIDGKEYRFPNRLTKENIRGIRSEYKNLPDKQIEIGRNQEEIIKILKSNGEYYNFYKFGE